MLCLLAARISAGFHYGGTSTSRTIQKVKDHEPRDVVTALDLHLHELSARFVDEHLPGCRLLSEEGMPESFHMRQLLDGEWLVVDPLDGSNNHALGLPHFGYMAAHLRHGRCVGAVIVLPEHNQYLVLEAERLIESQPLPGAGDAESGTVYYGYPPRQTAGERAARTALMELIDLESAGMYRYGSACAGLYHLVTGKHLAFFGHGLRIWDALAFLPLLHARKIPVRYAMRGLSITLVAGRSTALLTAAQEILQRHQDLTLQPFDPASPLQIEAP